MRTLLIPDKMTTNDFIFLPGELCDKAVELGLPEAEIRDILEQASMVLEVRHNPAPF